MQDGMHRCSCDHLTNFAILIDEDDKVTFSLVLKEPALVLNIVTYIGCGVSLVCLLIIFLTFVVFKQVLNSFLISMDEI